MAEDGGASRSGPALVVKPEQLTLDLVERIRLGEELKSLAIGSFEAFRDLIQRFRTWDDYNVSLLESAFTTTGLAEYYSPRPRVSERPFESKWSTGFAWSNKPRETDVLSRRFEIEDRCNKLRSICAQIQLYPVAASPTYASNMASRGAGENIFIVHGHDGATRMLVARFVEEVTTRKPVILHEQSNRGRTIVEKFEQHAAEAAFAIVLLTGDDEGRARSGSKENFSLRARQNVVFELGFFIAALGRDRVAALHDQHVELPSDVKGMLYIAINGNWQLELAREMRVAGIDVDLNRAT